MMSQKFTISIFMFLMIFSIATVSATSISDTTSIFSGNITPSLNNTYSLGSPGFVWKDLYVGAGSIYLDDVIIKKVDGSLAFIVENTTKLKLADFYSQFAGEVRNIDDIDSVSRFSETNINNGTNAIAALTATNNLNYSLWTGILGGNFNVPENPLLSANIGGLFLSSPEKMGFFLGYNKGFIWANNPFDDGSYDNSTSQLMYLDENGALNISGDLFVGGDINFGADLNLSSDLDVGGDLNVSGDGKFGGEVSATNFTVGDPYTLYEENGDFKITNGTQDLMLFNTTSNEWVFTTNTELIGDLNMVGIITHNSPVEMRDGIAIVLKNATGYREAFHIFISNEKERAEEYHIGLTNATNNSLIFATHSLANPYQMGYMFFDDVSNRSDFVISQGGANRSSMFDRSLQIGKSLGIAPIDENYTLCQGFNLIDCDTLLTGADLGVEDDIEAKGSILAQENITADYFIGDGSQLTGVNIITQSTGLIEGGVVSVNGGDITLIDISAGSGQIVDSTTDPDNPTLTSVTWENKTGYNLTTMPDPGDVVAIYLALDSGGNVVERSALPTPEERRNTIDLGIAARIDNGIIVFAGSGPTNVIHNPSSQVQDLMEAWGAFNIDGNRILSYGAGLQIQKSAGSVFRNGANFQTNEKNPNVVSLAEQAPVDPFNYKLGDGTDINLSSNQLDPNNYDDGTSTLATVPNNKWTIQYVSVFALGLIEILYGQEIFDSEEDAIVAMSNIDFIIPADSQNAIPLAYVILQQSDTSLTDDRFYRISRGGAAGGGGVTYTAGTGLILNGGTGTELSLNTTYTDDRYLNSNNDTGNFNLSGNLTLSQKLTFGFGEIIDNIVDGWIRVTGNLEVIGTVKIEDDLNMTSNNITTVDCVVFISGGRICDSP